jgi:hypothetical protein
MSELVVRGGAGGVGARLQDLRSQAGLLDGAGDDVRGWCGSVATLAVHPDVTAAALLCPVEVAQVAGAVAGATIGVNGLLVVSTGLEASAVVLRASATTYECVDATQQQILEALQNVAGMALGAALPVLGGGLVVVGVGAGLSAVSNPAMWPALIYAARSGGFDDVGGNLNSIMHDNPWLLDALARMAPGMVQGMTWSLSTALGGPLGGLTIPTILSGGQWPTGSYEGAVGGLINAGNLFGMFHDGAGADPRAAVNCVTGDFTDHAPRSVQDIFREQRRLGAEGSEGQVQITEVTGADGTSSWIVQIPGTQEWSPFRGDNPVDATTNVKLMAGDATVIQQRVGEAMRRAGIQSGDPVMLTGHSQGGITAAALASDPAFGDQFSVRTVVTGGSPIGRMDIPGSVSVLALEHSQDAVPMLDGRSNPDRTNWLTVERSLPSTSYQVPHPLDPGTLLERVPGPGPSHDTAVYTDTGRLVDESTDPSVRRWRDEQAAFFDGEATVTRWDVSG